MTEEEKRAISLLKSYENKLVYEISDKDKKAVKILLKLIEKQQNKIASQEKQIKLMQSCDLGKVIKEQEKEIEELKEEINQTNKDNWEDWLEANE